jgi:hypothetical protein
MAMITYLLVVLAIASALVSIVLLRDSLAANSHGLELFRVAINTININGLHVL